MRQKNTNHLAMAAATIKILHKRLQTSTKLASFECAADIQRILGEIAPLGKTTVEFNFTWKNAFKK